MVEPLAVTLMNAFARDTGLVGEGPERRYLWTDAFAVCNFLGLRRQTGEERYLDLARRLIDRVHRTLGRHREDDERTGWLSGLPESEGPSHPTRGGLRIGKPLPERAPDETHDPLLEWDRDGQYFHYLTRWMHALHRTACETGDPEPHRWATELAENAHARFTHRPRDGEPPRLYWKMSIDLARPLIASTGLHDPLDDLVTALTLRSSPERLSAGSPDLRQVVEDATAMCRGARWETDDPLGIGGLLIDACVLAQLHFVRGVECRVLLLRVLDAARTSLRALPRSDLVSSAPEHRLAFRELGLSIGLHAANRAADLVVGDAPIAAKIDEVRSHGLAADHIESFWSVAAHRASPSWLEHEDINTAMLATSLAPDGYLSLGCPG